MGPSDPPALTLEFDPAIEYVTRDELAKVLVDMLDDELRNLGMRVGILKARREKIVKAFPHLNE